MSVLFDNFIHTQKGVFTIAKKENVWGINCGYTIEVPEGKEALARHFFGVCEAIREAGNEGYYIDDILAVAEALGFETLD